MDATKRVDSELDQYCEDEKACIEQRLKQLIIERVLLNQIIKFSNRSSDHWDRAELLGLLSLNTKASEQLVVEKLLKHTNGVYFSDIQSSGKIQ